MNILQMCNGLLLPSPSLLEFVYSQVFMSYLGDLQVSINSAITMCDRLYFHCSSDPFLGFETGT